MIVNRQLHELLLQNLAELKLTQIAETYREVLDEAARKNTSMLEVLAVAGRPGSHRPAQNEPWSGGFVRPNCRNCKTLAEYNFDFPKRIPKQKILRLFDCEFVEQRQCAVLIGPTGTGKTHLLTALAYTACERGISVRFTRVIDMINTLTTAQINGTLERALEALS